MKESETEDDADDRNKGQQKAENGFLNSLCADLKQRIRTAKFWLEAIAVVGGIFYAVVTYRMWVDSHTNFVTGERAWIGFDIAFPEVSDLKEQADLSSTITIKNLGHTPAKKISGAWVISIQKAAEAPPFNYRLAWTDLSTNLYPNGTGRTGTKRMRGHDYSETLTKTEVDDLINGRSYIAVYGQGEYTDAFNELHWFRVCEWHPYFKEADFTARSCVEYSDFGDGPLPPKE